MNKNNWRFSLKLFICTALLALISIIFVSISSYNKYSLSLREQSSEKAQQIVELTSLNIQTYLDDLYRLSLSPYYNQNVMDALDKSIDASNLKSLYRTRTIEDFLEQMLIIPRSDILRVFILTDEIYKGERIPSTINPNQNYNEYDWYQKALELKEPILVSAHKEQIITNPTNIVFSIVNILKSTRNLNKTLGVIKVDANYSGISDICNKVDFGQGGGIFIMDSDHQIIFSNLPSITNDDLNMIYNTIQNKSSQSTTIDLNNNKYLINSQSIENANWEIIGVTSLATINEKINEVKDSAFYFSLICFILSLFLIVLYLKIFLNPLNRIIENIHKVQEGNFNVVFDVNSKDELGYLADTLNTMVSELKIMFEKNTTLLNQVYEAKYLQKEAQINSLFNQIQPHFINNALNMISMLIQSNKYEQAVYNINKLSIILRTLIHLDKDIKVSNEIELLDAYLTIQQNRYFDRLYYNIEIDPSLKTYLVPALILQPIVENSVIHGCESKKSPTTILIYSELTEEEIIFIIKDNGKGMSHKKLLEVRNNLESNEEIPLDFDITKKRNGIALININKRIKIKYGHNYGLTIYSKENQGTTVKIILPKQNIQEA